MIRQAPIASHCIPESLYHCFSGSHYESGGLPTSVAFIRKRCREYSATHKSSGIEQANFQVPHFITTPTRITASSGDMYSHDRSWKYNQQPVLDPVVENISFATQEVSMKCKE